ncbi:MAG: Gfo/Idh/MocA family oxidoreductase, partial [Phycisphaerae bacterium]
AVSRRRFLGAFAGAAATVCVVPRHVLGGAGRKPPSDTLNIAGVGLGAMGADNLRACGNENIVALCDVDRRMASTTFQRYPKAKQYKDYRRMLESQKGLDAVIVATPDHTHAAITAAAMKAGKHVYTQMPLTHDVWEARELAGIAREAKVATQMGNERYSGPTVRSVCEWIWDGCIGPVREVHCWTNRPQWPQGSSRPKTTPAVPAELDWDLWLGPAPERPYHGAYHPYNWRGWRDFGTGALGAIGCHEMDGAFWALKLAEATTVTVEADSAGGTAESYPRAATVRYRFGARGDMPPVTLTWYDGGRRPPRPKELPDTREFLGSNGTIFVGDKGKLTFGAITAGTNPGQAGPRFIPESLGQSYSRPRQTIPRVKGGDQWIQSSRHVYDWLRACKGGRPACSRFEIAGPLTEIVLLGNVALLSGKPIEWDPKKMKVVNEPEANRYVRRPRRSGWDL